MYWLNISDMEIPFLALIEHTNFAPRAWYGGKHLLYIGNYLMPDHPLYNLPKEELLKVFTPHIQKVNPAFDRPGWRPPISPATVGPSGGPPALQRPQTRLRDPLQNVFLANMSLIYPEDRGTNFAGTSGTRWRAGWIPTSGAPSSRTLEAPGLDERTRRGLLSRFDGSFPGVPNAPGDSV
jgi:hypothetical protein